MTNVVLGSRYLDVGTLFTSNSRAAQVEGLEPGSQVGSAVRTIWILQICANLRNLRTKPGRVYYADHSEPAYRRLPRSAGFQLATMQARCLRYRAGKMPALRLGPS